MRPFLAVLMLSAVPAWGQVRRNGPEYGGFDHQPTHAGVVARERRAGIAPSRAQVRSNRRTVDQFDRQLLHDEKVDPPGAYAQRWRARAAAAEAGMLTKDAER